MFTCCSIDVHTIICRILNANVSQYLGPRIRRPRKMAGEKSTNDEKRPRTAFSGPQLARLKVNRSIRLILLQNRQYAQ